MKTLKYEIFQIVQTVRGKEWINVWFDATIIHNDDDAKRIEKKVIEHLNKLKNDHTNETFSVLSITEEEIDFGIKEPHDHT